MQVILIPCGSTWSSKNNKLMHIERKSETQIKRVEVRKITHLQYSPSPPGEGQVAETQRAKRI